MSFLRTLYEGKKSVCKICGKSNFNVAEVLGVCIGCIRKNPDEAIVYAKEAHRMVRLRFDLPPEPPKTPKGIPCIFCANECSMGPGERSFCGLKENRDGKLSSLTSPDVGVLYAYKDPHVTNCCAAWFCPAGTGAGYPKYAYRRGPEYGYANYAVFFYGCNFSCLYCQNYSHKEVWRGDLVPLKDFVEAVELDKAISCICYFGGSPEPNFPFAIKASQAVLNACKGRILRICFEWNGCGYPSLVRRATELALESGGNIKFDLKCFDENLSLVLSGTSNVRAYENFKMIAEEYYDKRPDLPVLTATTLLVPGYVDSMEVEKIASFISELNPDIPYSLLIFHPDFMMRDLPITPLKQVVECYKVAKKYLNRVHVGNLHLLGLSMKALEGLA